MARHTAFAYGSRPNFAKESATRQHQDRREPFTGNYFFPGSRRYGWQRDRKSVLDYTQTLRVKTTSGGGRPRLPLRMASLRFASGNPHFKARFYRGSLCGIERWTMSLF